MDLCMTCGFKEKNMGGKCTNCGSIHVIYVVDDKDVESFQTCFKGDVR